PLGSGFKFLVSGWLASPLSAFRSPLSGFNSARMDSSIQPATWGAIFDWDGVIIDSSSHHEESWERLARETRRALPPGHFKKGFGRKNEFIIPEILEWTREAAEIARLSLRNEAT